MNGVQYYGTFLMKGSIAYELHEAMKKDPAAKQKLDAHMKEVNKKCIPLPTDLVNFKIGSETLEESAARRQRYQEEWANAQANGISWQEFMQQRLK